MKLEYAHYKWERLITSWIHRYVKYRVCISSKYVLVNFLKYTYVYIFIYINTNNVSPLFSRLKELVPTSSSKEIKNSPSFWTFSSNQEWVSIIVISMRDFKKLILIADWYKITNVVTRKNWTRVLSIIIVIWLYLVY